MAPFIRMILSAAIMTVIAAAAAGCSAQASGDGAASTSPPMANLPKTKAEPERIPVTIAGRTFKLEPALDDPTRTKGLGSRDKIADDGGMVFVFPVAAQRDFVMRDCPIPIDIMYLDGAGRILSMHAMTPEKPRGDGETNDAYEDRLPRYPSRFPTAVVVELRGGMIKELGLKPGDKLTFDIPGLKARAR